MFKKLIPPIAACLIMVACKKENKETLASIDSPQTKVLIARQGTGPVMLYDKKLLANALPKNETRISDLPSGTIAMRNHLGRGYQLYDAEFGSAQGVKLPVVNIEKFATDFPDFVPTYPIGSADAQAYSFARFDRYVENTKKTTKTSGGFNLDFGLFSIGAKHSFDRTFSSNFENNETHTFGQLDITVRDLLYEMVISSATKDQVKADYLQQSFIDQIYNLPPYEARQLYGQLVITGFYSGGKATALFIGKNTEQNTSETKEKNMLNSINASFLFKKGQPNDNSSADFGLGNSSSHTIAAQNKLTNFQTSFKTYGGGYGFPAFTVPKSVELVNVDFGPWLSSMNDKSRHILVDFKDGGLMPIADLVEEENTKNTFTRSGAEGYELPVKPLMEPRLEGTYHKSNFSNSAGFLIFMLRTRFGDYITLKIDQTFRNMGDNALLDSWTISTAQSKLPFYNLQVVSTHVSQVQMFPYSAKGLFIGRYEGLIDEASTKKYYDSKRSIWYLLSESNGAKIAYSIRYDYLFDTYGIRNWVNSMSSRTITAAELKTFKIIAL